MRELAAEERFPDLTDGLRVDHGDGFAMLITGTGQPDIRIFGEAQDAEFAKELCERYTGRVKEILKESGNAGNEAAGEQEGGEES